jgi:hypothetical protein
MTVLQKDHTYEIVQGESYTVTTPGTPATPGYWTSLPPSTVPNVTDPATDTDITTAAINETPGYIRLATWAEVKLIWPCLTNECAIQIKILETLLSSPTLGTTIFKQYSYRKEDQPLDGGPLLMYTVYIALQRINGGVAFCAVTGPSSNIVVEPNPIYIPNYEYIEGTIDGC